MSLTMDLNGHLRPEVVFIEIYVFGELKCNIEIFLKNNKSSSFVHIIIVFKIRLQQKLE